MDDMLDETNVEIHTFNHMNDGDGWNTAIDAMTQFALDIEKVCEERGWEEEDTRNTFLGAVFITIDDPDEDLQMPEVCWVSPLPVPGFVAQDLPQYLPIVASTAQFGMSIWRQSWAENVAPVGCVVTFEGWSLPVPVDQMTPEQQEAMDNHTIHLREDRVEERGVLLFLYDGQAVIVHRRRGEEPTAHVFPADSTDKKMRGIIPSSMRELTKAVTGVLWEGGE